MAHRFSSFEVLKMRAERQPVNASALHGNSKCTQQGLAQGFAYLGLLFIIAIMGVLAAGTSALWSIDQKRQKEKELLFIGNQYRQAIASYYEHSPGAVKQFPQTWEDLLGDNRFIVPMRHLRKIYRDPVTLAKDWGLVRGPDGGIAGVYSASTGEPMKKDNFDEANTEFAGKTAYRDWRFVYNPPKPIKQ